MCSTFFKNMLLIDNIVKTMDEEILSSKDGLNIDDM